MEINLFVVNGVIFVIILFLLGLLSWIWPPDSPWSFWWTTSKEKSRKMCRLVKLSKKDIFYELGSGEGTTVLIAAKEFGSQCIGIEIDPVRYIISRIRILFSNAKNKITVIRKNFFDVDLSRATVVYAYLVPKALLRLKPKFLKELKPGTRIISYRYPITYLPKIAEDKKEEIYVYEVRKRK